MPELGDAVPELGLAVSATPGMEALASTIDPVFSDFGRPNVAVGIHGASVSLSSSSSASIFVQDETRCPG